MLNPEYVDYDDLNRVKIGFTDTDADVVLEIILDEKDAYDLGEMIIEQRNEQVLKKKSR